jgi:3',5'-cyclic AMP phosphodiesterase CpdA
LARPFLLAQLSDPHIGADWFDDQSVPRLAAAVESVCAFRPQPDAVLLTGDLADHEIDEEYEQLLELLAPLGAPVHVLPGNHDDRGALHRHFGVPGGGGERVCYAVDLGPLRLVALDSKIPGEDSGALGAEQLDWLEAELASAPEQPTLLAMHHPPLVTGVPAWDELGLAVADRQALGEVIARHAQVRRLACGHFHRTMTGELAGRGVVVAPSTYVQMRPNFLSKELDLTAEPAGFALHAVVDGDLITHVQTVQRS